MRDARESAKEELRRRRGGLLLLGGLISWVAVKERNLKYHNAATILFTICAYCGTWFYLGAATLLL